MNECALSAIALLLLDYAALPARLQATVGTASLPRIAGVAKPCAPTSPAPTKIAGLLATFAVFATAFLARRPVGAVLVRALRVPMSSALGALGGLALVVIVAPLSGASRRHPGRRHRAPADQGDRVPAAGR